MSRNRNPTGKNQHGWDPVFEGKLEAALHTLHREGHTDNHLISQLLAVEPYNLEVNSSKVKRRRATYQLYNGGKTARTMPHDEQVNLVLKEVERDTAGQLGPRRIREKVIHRTGVHLPREVVRGVMLDHAPEHFPQREPTADQIIRVAKDPEAIHQQWSLDGHDKWNAIGFGIYGLVDDSTGHLLHEYILPSNRLGQVVLWCWLDQVEKYKGMSVVTVTDCGSETTLLYGAVNALRERFHPELTAQGINPAHVYVRSVHNVSVERTWLRLRKELGNTVLLDYMAGVNDGVYSDDDAEHKDLSKYLWSTALRNELDTFTHEYNAARVRLQHEKLGPSGMSRNTAFALPILWHGANYLQQIPEDEMGVIAQMKADLGGEEITRFVSAEFAQYVERVLHDTLGLRPQQLLAKTTWAVFTTLLPKVFPHRVPA
ncbi:hypothetical protein GGX14DRAFT_407784 [Mycena pura]|uniref:Integrase core domain-containing protein n=1 Tax=Mycena pura TaxID=153505 RepID=A0AAD6UQK4_9AGAR|nr:hypothetical protein GGX14DRAFT_407784 [Mycena pura]